MRSFRLLAVLCVFLSGHSQVSAQFIFKESFTGTDAPGWEFARDSESGDPPGPRLTAGNSPTAEDPETGNTEIDADGSGWLRLATTTNNQSNAVALDTIIPSSGSNIKISFDYTMWGGGENPADGINVFLWDADVDFDPGAFGGSLGYAQKTDISGLAGAYIGVGLDVWGNYSNDGEGRSGGYNGANLQDSELVNQIAVRGPDVSSDSSGDPDNMSSYEFLAGTGSPNYINGGNIDSLNPITQNLAFGEYNFRPDQDAEDYRSFEMELTENNMLTVRAQFGYEGEMETLYTLDLSDIADFRPESLRIGFGAATGSAINVHEIRNLGITASGSIDARSNYWDNEDGDQLWNTALNWNNNTVPEQYDFVVFSDQFDDTKTAQTVYIDGTNPEHRSITFSGATPYTINPQSSEILIFDSNTELNKSYLSVLNSPNGNADHTINAGIRADDTLLIQNFVKQTLTLNGDIDTRSGGSANDLIFGTTGTTLVNGVISGDGDINTNESGVTVFNGNNTYTGRTTVEDGILRIRHDNALGSTSDYTVVENGGTLQFDNSITVSDEQLEIEGTGQGGKGALNNLSGNNTIDGSAYIWLTGDATIKSEAGTLSVTGSSPILTLGYDLTLDTATSSTISISRSIPDYYNDGTNLYKNGGGTAILSNSNAYGGETIVNEGVLRIENGDALGTTDSGTTVNSGATLSLSGGIETPTAEDLYLSGTGVTGKAALWSESGSNLWNGDDIYLSGGNTSVGANTGATLRIDGAMSGSGESVTITGGGTTVYEEPMEYTGETRIESGTLLYEIGSNRIADESDVIVSSGANLNVNGHNDTVGSLAGGGNVQLGSATYTAGYSDASTTYSGTMSGTGNFTKIGTGTMTFDGTNTFTGSLTVDEGTVQMSADNAFANNMRLVMDGGTFAANGASDTMGAFELNSSSTMRYVTQSNELLTFSSIASSPSGTFTMSNWAGVPFTASGTPASTNTAFFVTSGSITGDMTTLASNTVFEGWGNAAGWKTVSGGYELVPTLSSGVYRWDRDDGDWASNQDDYWLGDEAPPNNSSGTTVYFGDDEDARIGLDNPANSKTISLTYQSGSSRRVGTMILNGTNGRSYNFQSSSSFDRTLEFDQSGTATAYLTVGGTEAHTIGSSGGGDVNISLLDDLLIQNNSTATTGLTIGTSGGSHTFATNGNDVEVKGVSNTLIHSQITGSGSITKSDTGTLTLTDGSNSYSGGTILNEGKLGIGSNSALGSGTLTINGGTLQATGATRSVSNNYAIQGDFSVVDDSAVGGNQNLTISGNGTISGQRTATIDDVNLTLGNGDLTGSGGLIKAGDGTLTMHGNNSDFSGGLTVNEGTVTTGSAFDGHLTIGADASNRNYLGTGAITVNSGGTLTTYQNVSGGSSGYDFTAAGELTNNGGTITITNSRANEYNADTYLNGATINQNSGSTRFVDWNDLEVTGASEMNVSGGNLDIELTGSFNNASPNSNAFDITVTGGSLNVTLDNAESDSAFTIGTDDSLTLNGPAVAMTVDTGGASRPVNLNGEINLLNESTLTVTQGTTYLGSSTSFNGGTAATAGTLIVQGDLSINEPMVAGRPNVTIDSDNATSITAPNSGSSIRNLGTLEKTGDGTTTIDNDVNNIGAREILITGGTLALGASNQLENSNDLILSGDVPGSGFSTNGYDEVINSLTLTSTSTIDMGDGSSIFRFLGGGSIADGELLNITNWSGVPQVGGGTDQIIFGERLPSSFLDNVFWGPNYGYGAIQLASGEIVPIPEPGVIVGGILLLGLGGVHYYRRRKAQRPDQSA